MAGARLAVDELTGLLRGRVAVGMVSSCGPLGLAGILADFHEAHPGVEITLEEAVSARLVDDVRAGRLDTAVVALAGAPPPDLAVHVVVDERLVAAVGRDDPLAGAAVVPLAALRGRPLVAMPRGTGLRACVDDACAAAGFRPNVAFEAGDPNILADLAARGLGLAVLPESLGMARSADLHAAPIADPELRGRLALAWRSAGPAGPAARALIEHARASLPAPVPR